MLHSRRWRSVLIVVIALAAALPLAVRAALPAIELMLGDQITVTCPTSLTSIVEGDQMTLTCLPGAPVGPPGNYRIVVPAVSRF